MNSPGQYFEFLYIVVTSVFNPKLWTDRHLRDDHCSQEGGSFVCRYGYNGVCTSLPVEGVSDRDYEDHVARNHIKLQDGKDTGMKNSRIHCYC